MPLPSIKNSVGMAVTSVASAGVGTITLGAALSGGYQTASTAYAADANIDIRIEEGDTWEVCRDCTYTHSGTTVTRGTLEDGSSGTSTRVAFTSAAKVYVVESAERMRRTVGGYLEHASHDGSAAVTGVVGTLHVFTGLTADRVFTLPASAQAGDRIGITFPAGSASYEILLKSASGDKINNVDCSSTEWSRLFIAGETVIFRCVDASTVDWIVEHDGRIPCNTVIVAASAQTGISGSAWVTLTQGATGSWTASPNIGGIADTANNAIVARRDGRYIAGVVFAVASLSDQLSLLAGFRKNGAGNPRRVCRLATSTSGIATVGGGGSLPIELSVGDYLQAQVLHTDSTARATEYISGESVVTVSMQEIL